jgi:hypothetical protein
MDRSASASSQGNVSETSGVEVGGQQRVVRPLRSKRLRCLRCNSVREWENTLVLEKCCGETMALIFTVGMCYDNLDGRC